VGSGIFLPEDTDWAKTYTQIVHKNGGPPPLENGLPDRHPTQDPFLFWKFLEFVVLAFLATLSALLCQILLVADHFSFEMLDETSQ
jgi:hypothetical protein